MWVAIWAASVGAQTNSSVTTPSAPSGPNIGSPGNTRPGAPPALSPSVSFVSGRVAIENGGAIPSNIAIQKVCSFNVQTVAYTDTKGRFSFQWGRPGGVSDASESPTRSADPGANCQLRAALAGYRSETIDLAKHRPTDNPDVGMIMLHRNANVEGLAVSATSLRAPEKARRAYEKGLREARTDKYDSALKDFEKAAGLYPGYADAWTGVARARARKNETDKAIAAYRRAIDADRKLIEPWIELGTLLGKQQKWAEAAQSLDRGLELDPVDYPQAWYADAMAHYYLAEYDAAEKSARQAIRLDERKRNPRASYVLGMALAQKREYAGAATELQSYLDSVPDAADAPQVRQQLAEIEKFRRARQR